MYASKQFQRIRALQLCGRSKSLFTIGKEEWTTGISRSSLERLESNSSSIPKTKRLQKVVRHGLAARNVHPVSARRIVSAKTSGLELKSAHPDDAKANEDGQLSGEANKDDIASPWASFGEDEGPSPKSQKPYIRRELPVSPFMNPKIIDALEKRSAPKAAAKPREQRTPFQLKLEKNPYAQALATPVRMCFLTQNHLPRFFLQDFELVKHPESDETWYLPRSLRDPYKEDTLPSKDLTKEIGTDKEPTVSKVGKHQSPSIGPKTWVLSRYNLLASLSDKNAFYQRWRYWLGHRQLGNRALERNLRFREDIHDFVLTLMRRRTVESLLWLNGKGKASTTYLSRQDDFEKLMGKDRAVLKKGQVGAVLWLGKVKDSDTVASVDEQAETEVRPGEFATIDIDHSSFSDGMKIPVYNLPTLLGEENVALLRTRARRIFNTPAVCIKAKRMTVDVQLRLWKLQGYIATYAEHVDRSKS